jgi:raffinose/stachyose/melibiose transport system substrate-binding protein
VAITGTIDSASNRQEGSSVSDKQANSDGDAEPNAGPPDGARPAETISRRDFLRDAGIVSSGAVLAAGGMRSGASSMLSGRPRARRPSSVTNIAIWSWYTEDEPVWPKIQAEFHDAYPSLKVTPRTFGTLADYSPVIESAVSAGTAPDILAPATLAISYGQAGIVLDLKKELGSSFLADFFPSINAEYSLDGKQYAIGWEAQMFGMFYNPTLLAKAKVDFPETWADVIDSVPKFRRLGLVPVALNGNPSNNAADFFLPLITQASNNPNLCLELDQLTKPGVSWNSKPVIDAFTMLDNLVKADVFETGADGVTYDEALALFYTGKSAMLSFGSFIIPGLKTAATPAFNKLYNVGMWPAWSSGAKHWSANQAGAGWSVNAHGNVDAALTFLKWLYEPSRYAGVMNASDDMPATIDAAAKTANPLQRKMASWITDNGCDHILFGVGSETAAGNVAAAVIGGKLTPTQAAAQVQSQVLAARHA